MALFDQDQLKIVYFCPHCSKIAPLTLSSSPKCPVCDGDVIATKYNYSVWKTLDGDDKRKALDECSEKMAEKEKKKKLESMMAENSEGFIITTADLKQDYDVIGPVYFQINNRGKQFSELNQQYEDFLREKAGHNQLSNDSVGGREIMDILFLNAGANNGHQNFDRAFFIATEELKKRALRMGANAIVGMRQDIDIDSNGFQYFYMQMYGTAVKLK